MLAAGAVISAAQLAGATPSSGILSAPILARASFGADLMLQAEPSSATGLKWQGRDWQPNQLPEFLAMLRDQGYGIRIYVPFGREWFPYFMRRLGERPANVLFVIKAILGERHTPTA